VRLVALLAFSLSTLLCPGFITAQQNSPTVATEDKLPSDMRIPAILKVTLSSKKSKVGDPVKLEVAVDVHQHGGGVILPRHATLTGHVTKVVKYEKNKQAAMLSFVVERAEWKDHSATLDAPVYGADVLATDSRRGEVIDGFQAATLGVDDPLNIVNTEIQSDTRVGVVGASGYAHAIRDSKFQERMMELKRVPDPAIRSVFMKTDGDLHVPSELTLVLLNGMKEQ
jgi:hypothetical protein